MGDRYTIIGNTGPLVDLIERLDAYKSNKPLADELQSAYRSLSERIGSLENDPNLSIIQEPYRQNLQSEISSVSEFVSKTLEQLRNEQDHSTQKLRAFAKAKTERDVLNYRKREAVELYKKIMSASRHLSLAGQGRNAVGSEDVFRVSSIAPQNPESIYIDLRLQGSVEQPQATCERQLKAAVLKTDGSAQVGVFARGQGGVGKTCALRAIANDADFIEHFSGGVYFMQLGKDANVAKLIKQLCRPVTATGGSGIADKMREKQNLDEALDLMLSWFAGHVCLFIFDDVWARNGIDKNVLSQLSVLAGPPKRKGDLRNRILYSTRDGDLSRAGKEVVFEPRSTHGTDVQGILAKAIDTTEREVDDAKSRAAIGKVRQSESDRGGVLTESPGDRYNSSLGATLPSSLILDPYSVKRALQEWKDRLDTVRLMVLGGYARGKTSTIASLLRRPFDYQRASTEGVDLSVYYLILGQDVHDEQVRQNLARKDKFQSRFWERYHEDAENQSLDPKEIHTSKSEEKDEEQAKKVDEDQGLLPSSKEETTNSDAIKLADDAMLSTEYHNISVVGSIIRCWDFGGQREYEVAHELFISPRSILMLVFDLERFEHNNTRQDEVQELQRWLQMLYSLTAEDDMNSTAKSLVIVGTHRDSCKYSRKVAEYFDNLKEMLEDTLDSGITESLDLFNIKCIAIENREAVTNPQASGLQELEEHLGFIAKRIIESSNEVPLRWLAFLESIRNDEDLEGISLKSDEIMDRIEGFHFPEDEISRIQEVQTMLLFFRDLGEVVLFDLSQLRLRAASKEYVLFIHPEKILAALRVIIAPKDILVKGLKSKEDRQRIRNGCLTRGVLKQKWEYLEGLAAEWDRDVLVELFVSLDLFVELTDDILGIPALLKSGWDDWGWIYNEANKSEVAAVTIFTGSVPYGLVGKLVARMHRYFDIGPQGVRQVRSNAVLLTIQGNDIQATQIFMGFNTSAREVHWRIRGESYDYSLLGRCLTLFQDYVCEQKNTKICRFRHFFITNCPQGCDPVNSGLQFPIPPAGSSQRDSVKETMSVLPLKWDEKGLDVAGVSRLCKTVVCENPNCSNVCSYQQAMKFSPPSDKPGQVGKREKYVAFVSHAGPDKPWAKYLATALTKLSVPAFIDERHLKPSCRNAYDQMEEALHGSKVGVFILSPEFFGKKAPMWELREFLKRHEKARYTNKEVMIFPLFFRLTHSEASDAMLASNPKYRPIFEELGFFQESRQALCSTANALEAFKKTCRFTGLEEKRAELHVKSLENSRWRYTWRYMKRYFENLGRRFIGLKVEHEGLGGVAIEDYFDFAARLIAQEYHNSRKD